MNEKQRKLLIGIAAVIFMLLLYPPYHSTYMGASLGEGYHWIFATGYGAVNIGLLITQWIGVLIIGGLCYFLLKDRHKT